MTKIQDLTYVEADVLAEKVAYAFHSKSNIRATLRQQATAEFGEALGLTPIGAVNYLWDLADEYRSFTDLRREVLDDLHEEMNVYRVDMGRREDIAALRLDS